MPQYQGRKVTRPKKLVQFMLFGDSFRKPIFSYTAS
jgi:hypothetical protein